MDDVAFSTGNILVGNDKNTEGLEILVVPGVGFALQFFVQAVVAVTGKDTLVKVDGVEAPLWSRIIVPANGKLEIQAKPMADAVTGFRTYLCIRGGFPNIPLYLGSKSTSMGLGGYQVRS
jgi:urea carboxylase